MSYSVGGRLSIVECDSHIRTDLIDNEFEPIITSVVWSPDNQYLIWGDVKGRVSMYDMIAGHKALLKASSYIKQLMYNPGGDNIYCLSYHDTFRIIDVASGKLLSREDRYKNTVGKEVFSGKFRAVYGKRKREVKLFVNEKPTHTLSVNVEISSIAFSSNARILALAQRNGIVTCWNPDNGEHLYDLVGYNTVLFSPKGGVVATAAKNGTVIIWEEETGKMCYTLQSDNSIAISLAFSPEGDRLAVGKENSEIDIWDMMSRTNVENLTEDGEKSGVRCITFNPDGESLTAGYGDGTIILWSCPSLKRLINDVRQRMKSREFTTDEKRMFFLEDDQ